MAGGFFWLVFRWGFSFPFPTSKKVQRSYEQEIHIPEGSIAGSFV